MFRFQHKIALNIMDYDKQYEDDIEKATALSLETLALDQFRRNKLQYSSISDVSTATSILKSTCKNHNTIFKSSALDLYLICSHVSLIFRAAYNTLAIHRPRPGSNGNSSTTYASSSLPNSASNGSLAPPPTVPPRNVRSGSNRDEPDLISFTTESSSAMSTDASASDSHASLMQLIQNINATGNSFAPTQSGLQLVPYAGNLNAAASSQQPKMPLTSDQLTKLYSMGTYGRSPSIPLSSFNQFGFATASSQHATNAISTFAPSTFPLNSITSNVAAATSATSYMQHQTTMFAPPSTASPFRSDPTANTLYSPQNLPAIMSQAQSIGAFPATHPSFGANIMSPTDAATPTVAPKLPPRQVGSVSSSSTSDTVLPKPTKKENASAVHRRTSNVSKQLGDDLIDLDHGIVDK